MCIDKCFELFSDCCVNRMQISNPLKNKMENQRHYKPTECKWTRIEFIWISVSISTYKCTLRNCGAPNKTTWEIDMHIEMPTGWERNDNECKFAIRCPPKNTVQCVEIDADLRENEKMNLLTDRRYQVKLCKMRWNEKTWKWRPNFKLSFHFEVVHDSRALGGVCVCAFVFRNKLLADGVLFVGFAPWFMPLIY